MLHPNQPSFRLALPISGKKRSDIADLSKAGVTLSSKNDTMYLEKFISLPLTFEAHADLLNTLSFSIDKLGDIILYYLHFGQKVTLLASNFYESASSATRKVFEGTITRIKTRFGDNGRITINVECMCYGFNKMGFVQKDFVYPDVDGTREFARAESLSVEDVIRGIAHDDGFEVGVFNVTSDVSRFRFNSQNFRYQRELSDWAFINQLAEQFGCTAWITIDDNGRDVINFSSLSKIGENAEKIAFVYPLYGRVKDIHDNELIKFPDPTYNRPRILSSLSVDEDISAAYSVSRSASYYDTETGEYKESVSRTEIEDGKQVMIFYELDEARVAHIDETNPSIAKYIREHGPTSLKWGDPKDPYSASYYYKETKRYSEEYAVFDKAFFGITISARCPMDLNIVPQRTYPIRGILSYHSKNLESNFYLRGLKQIWDSDGCWTELDFIR